MKSKTNQNKINDIKEISLIIKSIIDKYGYHPKSKYFISNKNDEKFPENYNFEKKKEKIAYFVYQFLYINIFLIYLLNKIK